ncbi:hypothetical protein WG66_012956 [Moniliophthora roreri]|nr:hypothetical protein WG66_012956 [Moniliophthora roreri]
MLDGTAAQIGTLSRLTYAWHGLKLAHRAMKSGAEPSLLAYCVLALRPSLYGSLWIHSSTLEYIALCM